MPHRVVGAALAVGLSVVVSGTCLPAQDQDDRQWQEGCLDQPAQAAAIRYCEVRVLTLDTIGGQLAVDAREHGSIEVIGSESDSIVVHALVETQAPSDTQAQSLVDQVKLLTTGDTMRAAGPQVSGPAAWSVSYRIIVPERFDLTLTTINGPIAITTVTGRLRLQAVNGAIVLDSVGGDVRARDRNGRLDIVLGGTQWNGAGLNAETDNGAVSLTIPDPYSAHLETSTENGHLQVDFPIPMPGRFFARGLALDIGRGGPTVHVATRNGSLTVKPSI